MSHSLLLCEGSSFITVFSPTSKTIVTIDLGLMDRIWEWIGRRRRPTRRILLIQSNRYNSNTNLQRSARCTAVLRMYIHVTFFVVLIFSEMLLPVKKQPEAGRGLHLIRTDKHISLLGNVSSLSSPSWLSDYFAVLDSNGVWATFLKVSWKVPENLLMYRWATQLPGYCCTLDWKIIVREHKNQCNA